MTLRSAGLASVAILQIGANLASQLIIIRLIGVGGATDAYIAAQAVPMMIAAVGASSLQAVWLPRLSEAAADPIWFRREQSSAQGQAIVFLLPVACGLALTSRWWAQLIFPGFTTEQAQLTASLSVWLLLASVISSQSVLLVAGQRAVGRFFSAELASLAMAIGAIGVLFTSVPRFGIYAVAIVAVARAVLTYLLHLQLANWPRPTFRLSEGSRTTAKQLRTIVPNSTLIKANPLVDRFLSSMAPAGGVTALNLAQLGITSLASVLERAILATEMPELARKLKSGNALEAGKIYTGALRRIGIATALVALVLLVALPFWNLSMEVLLGVDAGTSRTIWLACMALTPGLFVLVAGTIAVGVFYALGEPKVPMVIGISGFVLSLPLKGILFHHFGIAGIALGASGYLFLNMVAYHLAVRRRLSKNPQFGRIIVTLSFTELVGSDSSIKACPLCSSRKFTQLASNDRNLLGVKTVGCDTCGLVQTNPRPGQQGLERFYRDHYRRFYQGAHTPDQQYITGLRKDVRLAYTSDFFTDRLGLSKNIDVLDFGCGEGSLFAALRKAGFSGTFLGVELNSQFGEFASKYGEATVFNAFPADRRVDLITVNHVLEHLPDPVGTLAQLKDLLRPDGLLYIDVPDVEMYSGILDLHIAHIFHFSCETLPRLVMLAGLQISLVEKHCPPHHPASIRLVARRVDETAPQIAPPIENKRFGWSAVRKSGSLTQVCRLRLSRVPPLRAGVMIARKLLRSRPA